MSFFKSFTTSSISIGKRFFSPFELCLYALLIYIILFYEVALMVQLACLLISVVIHEVAHAWVAYFYGDPTAKNLGRLSLNPVKHADPLGSVILPGILIFSGAGIIFGWAKPVPVNPRYFSQPTKHMMLVALAGPLSNITIAFIAGLFFKVLRNIGFEFIVLDYLIYACRYLVPLNLVLAIFNLFPIPPLDGSRILNYVLPYKAQASMAALEPYGFFIVMGCAYFGVFDIVFSKLLPILIPFFIT